MGPYVSKMFDFNGPLVELAGVDFLIQYAVFIVSAYMKTEKFYDLTGTFSFFYFIFDL